MTLKPTIEEPAAETKLLQCSDPSTGTSDLEIYVALNESSGGFIDEDENIDQATD